MSLTDILMGLWVSRLPLKERKQYIVKPPEPKIRCIELDTVYNSVVDALMQVFGKTLKQAKTAKHDFLDKLHKRGYYGGINGKNNIYSGCALPTGYSKLTWEILR